VLPTRADPCYSSLPPSARYRGSCRKSAATVLSLACGLAAWTALRYDSARRPRPRLCRLHLRKRA
jgi:hypothetical protein